MAKEARNINMWLVVAVIAAGIGLSYYLSEISRAFLVVGWVLIVSIGVLLAGRTKQGKRLWAFAKEARLELRKVVWPTRQETIQTTIVVAVMVVVMAFILWGVDAILLRLIGWLTGQRG